MFRRWLAGQFARPSGWLGRRLIGPWLDRLGRGMNRAALRQLQLQPGDRLLEVGFGGGDLLRSMLAEGAMVIGVDRSEAMVERARRRFSREMKAGRLRIMCGSAEQLPVPDRAADKACSVNALYFWDDPAAVMSEFSRVIRPGGKLVLCFQSAAQVRAWPGHRHGFQAYGEAQVRGWFAPAGFGSIEAMSGTDRQLGEFLCLSGRRLDAKAAL